MRPERFHADSIVDLLQSQRIATLEEIKGALGTDVDMTVFRKLRQIEYLRSYSHRGRFYSLRDLADFDTRGLWTYREIHFSRFGSLVNTVEHFVMRSDRGYVASELAADLDVEVKGPLLQLVQSRRLARKRVSGLYVYTSPEPNRKAEQIATRERESVEPFAGLAGPAPASTDEAKAAIILFMSTLNEKQRRLFAGLEALRVRRGGDRRVAEVTGMDVHTIAKGRKELEQHDLDLDRIRQAGGGRKPVEKKRRRSSRRSRG